MPVIIQMSLSNYGLSGALLILAGFSFHGCICGALYFPLERPKAKGVTEKLVITVQSADDEGKKHQGKEQQTTDEDDNESRSPPSGDKEKHGKKPFWWLIRLRQFLHSFKTFFKEGIDVSLFRDSTFWVLTASQFLSPFGFMPNLYYMPKLALALWSNDEFSLEERKVNAAFLISVNGIADIVGRAMFGIITNYGYLKRHRASVYSLCPIICAVGTILAPFIGGRGFPYLALCAAITGCFSGGFIALTPSILSDALGREKLSSSFALTLAIKGIGALLASPIAGSIVSLSLSRDADAMPYVGVYIFTAGASALSGLILSAWQIQIRVTRNKADEVGEA